MSIAEMHTDADKMREAYDREQRALESSGTTGAVYLGLALNAPTLDPALERALESNRAGSCASSTRMFARFAP